MAINHSDTPHMELGQVVRVQRRGEMGEGVQIKSWNDE
jgi:hypothetical protein